MNKCKKCGTEFEGKFCPECGEAWLAEGERLCPRCKKPIKGNEKFCHECGYSFENKRLSVFTRKSPESARTRSILFAMYQLVKYLPEILFLLFGLMAFGFLATPVATVPSMGGLLGLGNIGNAYTAASADGIDGIRNPAIALIIFVASGTGFALVCAYCAKIMKKSTPGAYEFFAFYLADLIICSVMIANTTAPDGGMGFMSAGACPICFIVFSILFAAGHIASLVFCKMIENSLDISAVAQERKARWEQYYAAHKGKLSDIYKIVKYLPEALFLLMSALAFAFLAAPVTRVSNMGLPMSAADVGNAYDVVSMKGIDGLRGPAIAFMAFATLGVFYSVFLSSVNLPFLKKGWEGTPTYTAFAFYLVYIIIGSAMIANTTALDGGVGVLTAGACPICFIVFSILFAAITVAALILRNKLGAAIKKDSVRKN